MTTMPFPARDYLPVLRELTGAFAEALRTGDPAAAVPDCAGWTLADLGTHLGQRAPLGRHRRPHRRSRSPRTSNRGPGADLASWYAESARTAARRRSKPPTPKTGAGTSAAPRRPRRSGSAARCTKPPSTSPTRGRGRHGLHARPGRGRRRRRRGPRRPAAARDALARRAAAARARLPARHRHRRRLDVAPGRAARARPGHRTARPSKAPARDLLLRLWKRTGPDAARRRRRRGAALLAAPLTP